MFQDYQSAYQQCLSKTKEMCRSSGVDFNKACQILGFDIRDYTAYYTHELEMAGKRGELLSGSRFLSELLWYRVRRPFFNVYPVIESKFADMSETLDMSELVMPYPSIEVRTRRRTMLLSEIGDDFMITVELDKAGEKYQEVRVSRKQAIGNVQNNVEVRLESSPQPAKVGSLEFGELERLIYVAVGVCMLAKDKTIVTPVVLNANRKESMSADEVARYAEKAINRTGRVGFDVGRELDRMPASVHYRNGHFAKFYVGKSHESYPDNCDLDKVPIIKWRCGAIVNKDHVPKVPTGFHDSVNAEPVL
jgi:hypothetical protein